MPDRYVVFLLRMKGYVNRLPSRVLRPRRYQDISSVWIFVFAVVDVWIEMRTSSIFSVKWISTKLSITRRVEISDLHSH